MIPRVCPRPRFKPRARYIYVDEYLWTLQPHTYKISILHRNLQHEEIIEPTWKNQPRKIIKPPKPPTQKNHQTLKPPTQKIVKPTWKTKTKNLKQINTHREKKNPGQRESDLIGSFPHSLSNQTHKKYHHLLQFRNPLLDPICDLHAST